MNWNVEVALCDKLFSLIKGRDVVIINSSVFDVKACQKKNSKVIFTTCC